MDSDNRLNLMAAAISEIRCLLSNYIGPDSGKGTEVTLTANLAYALHNEAQGILEGDGRIDMQAALAKIKNVEEMVGSEFADGHGVLRGLFKDS